MSDSPSEDAFLAAVDERLAKISRAAGQAAAVAGRRSWLALIGVVVALGLGLGMAVTVRQLQNTIDNQNADRTANRIAVCKNTNDQTEGLRKASQSLLDNARKARVASGRTETANETALRRQFSASFATDQGFRYDPTTDQVQATFLDCDLFAQDPAAARAKLEKERP